MSMRRPIPVRPNGSHFGMGWDSVVPKDGGVQFGKNGGVDGIEAWIEHLALGVDWAIVLNSGHHKAPGMPVPNGVVRRKVVEAVEQTERWPDIDLFEGEPERGYDSPSHGDGLGRIGLPVANGQKTTLRRGTTKMWVDVGRASRLGHRVVGDAGPLQVRTVTDFTRHSV
jgi:hypothetical protein